MPIEPTETPAYDTVLDVGEEQIARTYAEAVLDAAATAGVEVEVVSDLRSIRDEILNQHPAFGDAIRSAFLSHEERVGLLDRVLGGRVNPVTLNTLKVLSAHGRTAILRTVIRQTEKLHEHRTNRVRVSVTSADPLPDDVVDEVRAVTRAKLGAEPIVEVRVDPALVAGLEIRVGDTVYDGSLRTVLDRARRAMVNQTVERIERAPERFLNNDN
jgi:F-type H+-transporting ATPase subunit delta